MRTSARIIVLMLAVLGLGILLEAQNAGVVRGRVVDSKGSSVVRVKVSVATKWGFTDATGRYVLVDVPFGRHQVTLERGGKSLRVREVDVKRTLTEVPDLKWPF
jgi:hypothetical protein